MFDTTETHATIGAGVLPIATPDLAISDERIATGTDVSAAIASVHARYAPCGEDLITESLLTVKFASIGRTLDSLYYVELGANPQRSNTYSFYLKHGAAGVLVTGSAEGTDELRRARPRDVVLPMSLAAGNGAIDLNIAVSLAAHRGRSVDLLVINTESMQLDILRTLDLVLHRPLIIQCRQTATHASAVERILQENGYTLAARTSAALIFDDVAGIGTKHPPVNSFDVFDTLIARRCIDPQLVFAALETTHGLEGFARLRQEAELAVTGPDLTLDAIYAEVGRRLGLDANATATLKQAEIDVEVAQVIPINANLVRVRDGDLLLSDMYLPAPVIQTLLEKAGLDRRVGLVVSADGKRSGRLWSEVRAGFAIARHLGDNLHADVLMPRHFNIASEHTRLSVPTQVEQWCLDNGLRGLGELIRAARLRIVTSDPLARQLLWVQTQYNFPIMLLASVALHRHVVAMGTSQLLFSSRDCCLWHGLYNALFPHEAGAEYFYTSRRARVEPSAAYRAYARSRLGPNSLLIDVCGTGWSSARLLETLDLPGRALYFLQQLPPLELYEERHPTPEVCRVDAILGSQFEGLKNSLLEMCNYALHATVAGMRMAAGVAIPVFEMEERSPIQLALVAQQVECFRAMTADARTTLPGDSLWLADADIVNVIGLLYERLCQEVCLETAFSASHQQEDLQALGAMRFPPDSQWRLVKAR
jgi:hypothetical protein